MYQMFIESSVKFKVFVFWLLKAIYEKELIPESFLKTVLVALHKKGNARDCNNYRFLHLKEWLPRMFENAIHLKIEDTFDSFTPEAQTGGCKNADTSEHLVTMMSALNEATEAGEGIIYTFADITKCFDRVYMSDAHYWLLKMQADPKAVKVLSLLLSVNNLSIQGSDVTFKIYNGLGQGGVTVGRSSSACISDAMDRNIKTHPCPMIHNDVNISSQSFVDDSATADNKVQGVKYSGRIIEEALKELSLEAHPLKTVHVLCGNEDWIKENTKYLEENPVKIQNFNVKIAKSEKYLGLNVVSGTVSDIINANVKLKASKSHIAATEIRQEVRDPRMEAIGALKASVVLIQAKIIPILLYGTEAWLNISDDQYREMESILKEAITRILSLPSSTNYESLLMEISNYHIEAWIDCLKMCYFVKKLHLKKRGKLYRILRKDIINNNERGFIGDLRRICGKYKIPDVTIHPLTKEFIRSACRDWSRRRSMLVSLSLKKVLPMFTLEKVWTDHYTYPVIEARAITALRTGNLIFKNWCPYYIKKKYMGDPYCLFQPCREKDTLKHVLECEYYDTKFSEKEHPTKDWATYLVALHNERLKKFAQPLISCEGWAIV